VIVQELEDRDLLDPQRRTPGPGLDLLRHRGPQLDGMAEVVGLDERGMDVVLTANGARVAEVVSALLGLVSAGVALEEGFWGVRRLCDERELLFMVDEDGKRIPPDVFIPAAERYHLMPTVDRWVIRNAFAALARRRAAGDLQAVFAINLSATSLCDERLGHFIREQLATQAIPARSICFEITETAAVENLERACAFIDEMRAIGCTFARRAASTS